VKNRPPVDPEDRYPPECAKRLLRIADGVEWQWSIGNRTGLHAIAAEVLREVAEGRDPRRLFDFRKSTGTRDRVAMLAFQASASPECHSWEQVFAKVSGETGLDVSTVRRHWRAWVDAMFTPGCKLEFPRRDQSDQCTTDAGGHRHTEGETAP
jgi:hypothetical protein